LSTLINTLLLNLVQKLVCKTQLSFTHQRSLFKTSYTKAITVINPSVCRYAGTLFFNVKIWKYSHVQPPNLDVSD